MAIWIQNPSPSLFDCPSEPYLARSALLDQVRNYYRDGGAQLVEFNVHQCRTDGDVLVSTKPHLGLQTVIRLTALQSAFSVSGDQLLPIYVWG